MKSSLHLSANDMTYGTSNCSLRCENKKSLVALVYVAQCFLVRLMVMTARVERALFELFGSGRKRAEKPATAWGIWTYYYHWYASRQNLEQCLWIYRGPWPCVVSCVDRQFASTTRRSLSPCM
jgi:hypothetical protein